MIIRLLGAAMFAVLVRCPRAQAASADAGLTCVESLTLPTTGILAARASGSGQVRAIANVGADGQMSSLNLDGGDASLQWEVTYQGIPRVKERAQAFTETNWSPSGTTEGESSGAHQYSGTNRLRPSIIAKCLRFLLTSVRPSSIAVAATRESKTCKPCDFAYRFRRS